MHTPPSFPKPRPARVLPDALAAIRAHYLEMPGLSLTPQQVRRLCGLEAVESATCRAYLEELVSIGFLTPSADGRYRRAA